jgi:ABC-2 type transport system ATP-binding protein
MPGDALSAPDPFASGTVLSLKDVGKTFRSGRRSVRALDGVSLEVRAGKVTGLVGPDGAGKTTLMRLLCGLLLPDQGQVRVLGLDVPGESLKVQEALRYMPQRFGLYEDLTVRENLELYADLQGVPPSERPGRYTELMHMTGLGSFTRRLAGALSGGMKQKLGLACTLVAPPRLLLLDEPTVGVDPVSRRELWAIVYRLVKEEGMTVLLSTAYLDEAERCQEVVLMHEGRVLGQGAPSVFSQNVEGRTFQVTAPELNKRTLQTLLARASGVTDAIVYREGVRMVLERPGVPDKEDLLPRESEVEIRPVAARFEDSFVALLRDKAGAPSSPAGEVEIQPAAAGGEEVILVENVKRRFGDFYAVKGISFSVRKGEVFGLLGANGAGKSTTFRMLCGLLPASEGRVLVAGRDLRHAAAQARGRIGYMAQRFSLYSDLSVQENLRFFSSAYGLHGREQQDRIAWALREFELGPMAEATSGELPLGFKQRLALAASLMHHPEILFLDEPTSGVDPLARREFWQRIGALAEQGVTVLVTTHFMEEAEYCDRLVIMAQGEILAEGTPEETRARFRTEERPEPTMEDAFIALIEGQSTPETAI